MLSQMSIAAMQQDLAQVQGLTEVEMTELFNDVKKIMSKIDLTKISSSESKKIEAVLSELQSIDFLLERADITANNFVLMKCQNADIQRMCKEWDQLKWNEMYLSAWNDLIDIAQACSIMKGSVSSKLKKFDQHIQSYIKHLIYYVKNCRSKSGLFDSKVESYGHFKNLIKKKCNEKTGQDQYANACLKSILTYV